MQDAVQCSTPIGRGTKLAASILERHNKIATIKGCTNKDSWRGSPLVGIVKQQYPAIGPGQAEIRATDASGGSCYFSFPSVTLCLHAHVLDGPLARYFFFFFGESLAVLMRLARSF